MKKKLFLRFIVFVLSLNSTIIGASDNCHAKGFSPDPIQTLTRQLEMLSPSNKPLLPNFPITSCGENCFSLHSNLSSFRIELDPEIPSPKTVLSPSLKVLKLPSWSALEDTSLLKFWLVGHELHPQISLKVKGATQHTKAQQIAVKAIKTTLKEGASGILLVSPTGTGKTLILSQGVKNNLSPGLHLVTAHLVPLVDQLHQALQEELEGTGTFILNWNDRYNTTFMNEVEQAASRKEPVVLVITTQALKHQIRFLEEDHPDIYEKMTKGTKGIYLDEAHHLGAPRTKTSLLQLQEQSEAFLVGITATPAHHEVKLKELFEREHWSYLNGEENLFQSHPSGQIVEQLSLAIQEGEITPFEDLYVFGPVNFPETKENPLFIKGESDFFVLNPHHYNRLAGLLHSIIQSNKKGFIATASIAEAHRLAAFLSQAFKDTEFEAYHSLLTRDERQRILSRSEESKAHYIVAVRALDEGVDIPHLSAYIDLNANVSVKQMVHRIGRVLRLYPGKLGADVFFLSDYKDAKRAEDLLNLLDIKQVSYGFSGGMLRYVSSDFDLGDGEIKPLNREELLNLRKELENSVRSFWRGKPLIEEVAEILRRKGIITYPKYLEQRKSDPELQQLPGDLPKFYNMKWSEIQKLVGLKEELPPIEEVAEMLRKKRIRVEREYRQQREEDEELKLLPKHLSSAYKMLWSEIQKLVGLEKEPPSPIEEVAEILRRKRIITKTEYWEKRKSDPELQQLPGDLSKVYNMKWSEIQKLVGLKKELPIEEVAEILRRKNIQTEPEYLKQREEDEELQLLPKALPNAYNMPWSEIQKHVGLKEELPPIEEAAEMLNRKGITKRRQYWKQRKSDPELQQLPFHLPQAYNMKWSDLQRLMGVKVVARAADHTVEEVAEILQRKEIITETEYWEKRKSDPELQQLPFHLPQAYNMKWSDLQRLMGLAKPSIEEAAEILRRKDIRTEKQYWKQRKSDPELQKLPYHLPRSYNMKWSEIKKLL